MHPKHGTTQVKHPSCHRSVHFLLMEPRSARTSVSGLYRLRQVGRCCQQGNASKNAFHIWRRGAQFQAFPGHCCRCCAAREPRQSAPFRRRSIASFVCARLRSARAWAFLAPSLSGKLNFSSLSAAMLGHKVPQSRLRALEIQRNTAKQSCSSYMVCKAPRSLQGVGNLMARKVCIRCGDHEKRSAKLFRTL